MRAQRIDGHKVIAAVALGATEQQDASRRDHERPISRRNRQNDRATRRLQRRIGGQ
jgi:hypothetical protein